MGSPRIKLATKHAATLAVMSGATRVTLPLISIISKTPVKGARTTAVKKAAMPTSAKAIGSSTKGAVTIKLMLVAKSAPEVAPTRSRGANKPPGVLIE